MGTRTADKFITDAGRILGDTNKVRWGSAELLQWVNEAQVAVTALVNDAITQSVDMTAVSGAIQTLPSDAIRLVDVLNSSGGIIHHGDRTMLDALTPNWRNGAESRTPEMYFYNPADPTRFELFPPAVAGIKLRVVYNATPQEIFQTSSTLGIPDVYNPAVLEYMLYRAFAKDTEDVAPDLGRAQVHLNNFYTILANKEGVDRLVMPFREPQ